MKDKKNMLVFCSNPGIGKTYLCAAMAEWAVDNFNFVRYHKESDLLSKLRSVISEGCGDYVKALEFMIDDDVVFLDDVGSWYNDHYTNKDNEWKIEVFFHFIDTRYNSEKPTIITSNLTRTDFEKIYSPRIASRLFASENKIISIFDKDVKDKRSQGL